LKIKRIHIKEFGILRDQTLDELDTGIIVVGGYNRAGKTTFLHVLRHLGYGFRGVLFSEAGDYEVDSDIVLDSGEIFNIYLKGYAEPKIRWLSGNHKSYTYSAIYNNLDRFTYQQLFTITLDELQRLPVGVNKDDTGRLQSILLGAGLSDVIQVPGIEEEFQKEATKIGGKRGEPGVYGFKAYSEQIDKGLELREQALRQVDEYYKKERKLAQTNEKIKEIKEEKIPELEKKINRLDILKSLYDEFSEKIELETQLASHNGKNLPQHIKKQISLERAKNLKQEYQDAVKKYARDLKEFDKKLPGQQDARSAKDKILGCKGKLEDIFMQLSGLKEKMRSHLRLGEACREKEDEIKLKMNKINESWQGDFEQVIAIKTDEIEQDKLNKIIKDYEEVKGELKNYRKGLKDQESRKERLEKQYKEIQTHDPAENFKKYFVLALLLVISGLGMALINMWVGALVGSVGIVGLGLYLSHKNAELRGLIKQKENIRIDIDDLEMQIKQTNCKIEGIEERIQNLQRQIQDYRRKLMLKDDISPDTLKDYFRDIKDLKKEINELEKDKKKFEINKKEIEETLKNILETINALLEVIAENNRVYSLKDVINRNNNEKFFAQIEQLKEYLKLAENLDSSEKAKSEKENEILELLSIDRDKDLVRELEVLIESIKTYNEYNELKKEYENKKQFITVYLNKQPVKKAFDLAAGGDEELFKAFGNFYNQFASRQSVQKTCDEKEKELEVLKEELEALQESARKLSHEIEELATAEKLEKSQQMISEARRNLKPLAEKYAVYRAASLILRKARERFIEKTKKQSLKQAGEILSQITGGEYKEILLSDELTQANFKAKLKDDTLQETVDILSRGTREQLFIAVRISRIQAIQPPLPVILDDSLVNFDTNHLNQAIEIINNLSQTHQIFVLTCHPELVKYIAYKNGSAQYWKLDRGKFILTDKDKLISYLRG